MFPALEIDRFEESPYKHFIGNGKIDRNHAVWLDWLEHGAPWQLTNAEFYEQYEFSLLHTPLPPAVEELACQGTLESLRHLMSIQFEQPMSGLVDVTAHKLVAGQTIRIHNDFVPGGESHRLLLQINRHWDHRHGGYLMLFSGTDPESVNKIVMPKNGLILAFSISPRSYHAVSTVHSGERYTIVYSFYPPSNGSD